VPVPETGALLDALAGYADTATRGYDVGDVLHDLACRVPEVLGVVGCGVTLAHGGRVHFVTAPLEAISKTEELQDDLQQGPCVDAVVTAKPVIVNSLLRDEWSERWPEYVSQAEAAGLRSVAGIPMLASGAAIGALNMYDTNEREWTPEEIHVATILAGITTSYLLHASALGQQRRTSEQLQQALQTRIIIEQAKGVLAARHDVGVDDAFKILRKYARDHNERIHGVAHAIVNGNLRMSRP
jgi:GAF domain-containing protein